MLAWYRALIFATAGARNSPSQLAGTDVLNASPMAETIKLGSVSVPAASWAEIASNAFARARASAGRLVVWTFNAKARTAAGRPSNSPTGRTSGTGGIGGVGGAGGMIGVGPGVGTMGTGVGVIGLGSGAGGQGIVPGIVIWCS